MIKETKNNSIGDLKVEDEKLLSKGYNAKELVGKEITILSVEFLDGDSGQYAKCEIAGEGLEDKPLQTGAHNIMARLHAAEEQDMFPLDCKVIKLGNSNAFDLE